MDPTWYVTLLKDSLQEPPHPFDETALPQPYHLIPGAPLILDIRTASLTKTPNLPPIYCDAQQYNTLQAKKDALFPDNSEETNRRYLRARNLTNPFEGLGRSLFMDRAGLKLANIDALYHLTGPNLGYMKKRAPGEFVFCDVAGGPGAFTEYLQFRKPDSLGYGITLETSEAKAAKLDWNTTRLNMDRFNIISGRDGRGNIYTDWDKFTTTVLEHHSEGVDLVVADAGYEDPQEAMADPRKIAKEQEYRSSHLLLAQALIGIRCPKDGANFVVKVFGAVTEISAQIIFILACCFERISLFKPVTSRPANAERYLICWKRLPLPTIESLYKQLTLVAGAYDETAGIYVNNILGGPLPAAFTSWLTEQNNNDIEGQLQATDRILLHLADEPVDVPLVNLQKCLIVWNLPEGPLFRSAIKVG